jgi:pyruvate, orthophosphate dikinase
MTQHMYDFTEGDKDQKDLLGDKGANLAEMTRLGLPVPGRVHHHQTVCREYLAKGTDVLLAVRVPVARLETGRAALS